MAGVHVEGQQPSPAWHIVVMVFVHLAVHFPSFSSVSLVHATLSLQDAGHAPGLPAAIAVSQVSCGSTTPLPHALEPPVPPEPALPPAPAAPVPVPPVPGGDPSLHADMATKIPVNAPSAHHIGLKLFLAVMESPCAARQTNLAQRALCLCQSTHARLRRFVEPAFGALSVSTPRRFLLSNLF